MWTPGANVQEKNHVTKQEIKPNTRPIYAWMVSTFLEKIPSNTIATIGAE